MDEPPTREEFEAVGNAAMAYCREKNNDAIELMARNRRDHPHLEKFELVGIVTDLLVGSQNPREMTLLYVELLYETARKK